MNKKQMEKFTEAYKKAEEMMAGKTQEEVNAEIAKIKKTDITKALMLVYFEKFAKSKEEQEWLKGEFKTKAYVETRRIKRLLEVDVRDADGKPVFDENGKVIKEMKKVRQELDESYIKFDIQEARDAFIDHFNLTTNKQEKGMDSFDKFFER